MDIHGEKKKMDGETKKTSLSTSGDINSLVQNVLDEIDIITTATQNPNLSDGEGGDTDDADGFDWIPPQKKTDLRKSASSTGSSLGGNWPSTEVNKLAQNENDKIDKANNENEAEEFRTEAVDDILRNFPGIRNQTSSPVDPDSRRNQTEESLRFVPEIASYPKTLTFDRNASSKKIDFSSEGGISFLKDESQHMTRARRLALNLVGKKWYNPYAGTGNEENSSKILNIMEAGSTRREIPSLEKAWAYFEHVTLTRYIVRGHNQNTDNMSIFQKFRYSFQNNNEEFERAQPGERQHPTKLYDHITTPHLQVRTCASAVSDCPNKALYCSSLFSNFLSFV
jgi:hypothetical protein